MMLNMPRARALLVMCSCAVLSGSAWAQCARGAEYTQSEAVKRRYPDPPVKFDTPAFAPGKTTFTTYDEMMDYLEALGTRSGNMLLRTAGFSQEARVLPALLFTNAGRF